MNVTNWFSSFHFPLLKIESEIADEQLGKLEQVAALPMSTIESKTIKPLIATMDNLLREWILADKDVKGDTYALKKMMARFSLVFFFSAVLHSNLILFMCEWKMYSTCLKLLRRPKEMHS